MKLITASNGSSSPLFIPVQQKSMLSCSWDLLRSLRGVLKGSSTAPTGPATENCILRDWVFVSQWSRGGVDSQVELLAEVLPCPVLGSQIPHPDIVQWNVDGCPWVRVDLHMEVKNHGSGGVYSRWNTTWKGNLILPRGWKVQLSSIFVN